MKKENNTFGRFLETVWNFFASVKLALFTLFILATASIIGTVIPQNKEITFYIQQYGSFWTEAFRLLNISDMYGSWWFLSLLGFFSMNLIVCTIERLPNVWRLVVQDNLATTDPARLAKMGTRKFFRSSESLEMASSTAEEVLSRAGWKTKKTTKDGGILLFSQKGAWTRLGVYIVHMSILIIFVGAIIGGWKGHKGFVMIPEGAAINQFQPRNPAKTSGKLDFIIKCDFFTIDFYGNGQPKEYRSDLTVIENGKEILKKTIEVNDPLVYKGYTFYQSSFQEIDNEFIVTIKNNATGASKKFTIPPRKPFPWNEEGVKFGIVGLARSQKPMKYRFKIWFNDEKTNPSQFWVDEESPVLVERPGTSYSFNVKRRYYTGIQIAKDPGVWTVYTGCTLMLIGLYVAFFLSHRRIWAFVSSADRGTTVLISGIANKNRLGFEKDFESLAGKLNQTGKLEITQ